LPTLNRHLSPFPIRLCKKHSLNPTRHHSVVSREAPTPLDLNLTTQQSRLHKRTPTTLLHITYIRMAIIASHVVHARINLTLTILLCHHPHPRTNHLLGRANTLSPPSKARISSNSAGTALHLSISSSCRRPGRPLLHQPWSVVT
jgi:hypothetical protein